MGHAGIRTWIVSIASQTKRRQSWLKPMRRLTDVHAVSSKKGGSRFRLVRIYPRSAALSQIQNEPQRFPFSVRGANDLEMSREPTCHPLWIQSVYARLNPLHIASVLSQNKSLLRDARPIAMRFKAFLASDYQEQRKGLRNQLLIFGGPLPERFAKDLLTRTTPATFTNDLIDAWHHRAIHAAAIDSAETAIK